jgi:isocitrate/isopropylmalate dehydrogenase
VTKKRYKIGVIPGDGIGRDVVHAAKIVLERSNDIAETFALDFVEMDVGETAVARFGNPFPQETAEGIKEMDAVLFGAAGPPHAAQVLRAFRIGFDLYAKVCPVRSLPGTRSIHSRADLIVIRENTEGLYRGVGFIDGDTYVSLRVLTRKGMERIVRFSFELAIKEKRKKVTLTHKASALVHTDEPFRNIFYEIAKEYPAIEAEDMMVDACAMQMIMKPEKLDVIIAENANGDILSDVGGGITGGLGLAPSGNVGDVMAVFEPVHGAAPKYAGKNIVNPIATIMASKMMFDYLGEVGMAAKIEKAVKDLLVDGKVRTYDLGGRSSTTEVAEAICKKMEKT